MGDALKTGIIASFIAPGIYEPLKATYNGAYIHGYCGDLLAEEKRKKFCVNATHLIEYLPYSIKKTYEQVINNLI